MEIIIEPDYDGVCERACGVVKDALAANPSLVLGLATGRTPVGLYERLRQANLGWSKVRFFNLDELYGVGPDHPESFHHFLRKHLLDHLDADPAHVKLLRGDVKNLEEAADGYEKAIAEVGGIDLQILGVGNNGHIAFNEPGSSLGSRTRPKTLTDETLAQYRTPGKEPVSNFALTMGVGTIMEAKRLLMMVSGASKAGVVRDFVEGPLTAEVPASILQLHPRAVVVLDEAAASKLKRRDYYKWVFANKWRVGQKQ
ncbi:MAG TPA: glucosamine-6-phosphate deaminase [Planctomycetota bacterium]|nr:glucosamine-6-phosphate deaminase [Planctomycetota bacterium]